MKKKTPFLDFYKECMNEDQTLLGGSGLCTCFMKRSPERVLIDSFAPIDSDRIEYKSEIFDDANLKHSGQMSLGYYWGSETDQDPNSRSFNTTRQNVVLFCAAINNEL